MVCGMYVTEWNEYDEWSESTHERDERVYKASDDDAVCVRKRNAYNTKEECVRLADLSGTSMMSGARVHTKE
jgi:hypothetical protein